MGWIEKGAPTPFDGQAIPGLFFLDGDILAIRFRRDWTKGYVYPMIVFPSGQEFSLWEAGDPEAIGIVHLFGEMDLPLGDDRDSAYEEAMQIAECCGYVAQQIGKDKLLVCGHDLDENMIITYDNEARRMVDVALLKEGEKPPPPPLLDDKSRALLPELYSNEELGLDAPAKVRFFTPDSNWVWYASEFDGEDVFFGLVAGYEIEFGYFSLSELAQLRGPLGLPVERDRHFKPMTLREVRRWHEKERSA